MIMKQGTTDKVFSYLETKRNVLLEYVSNPDYQQKMMVVVHSGGNIHGAFITEEDTAQSFMRDGLSVFAFYLQNMDRYVESKRC